MTNNNEEFTVEYQFENTKFGKRAMFIRIFKTKEAADEFAATTKDGIVSKYTLVEF